ncbi:hypothetical protein COW09_01815 [bacterium (Candidatus Moisslbacteria) CG12_big_fil_rev_8_21_14_0_65_36_11]|nr:undecaprenyl/decaprenyl-phosphate alpha-N-acetylglucosaminyl 1-phosphate transferase [Candidatus Kuenenbacteria bacterium]OIP76748.1 MAG: hypothetical protein AUK09_01080 [Parcubacteria group bacterium CG2_30_36_38]PIV46080.1 MAG: hypothetical protein COS23_01055 [bacterium (Candidatus Moisslbacteria) CG02_land_8_20_14_3_00_36_53]PIW67739.1 MAG: hypothetical protein COW09_01815 [bacterium (Candidatus Moisslbacteria) CG12_big_fil_rev_8_21_14_0_65_36_11]PIZ90423.1 MAG: hypothetical protein COX
MTYLFIFFLSFFSSIVFTLLVRKLAIKFGVLDFKESAPERKFQRKPVPLLGGLAIFAAFFAVIFFLLQFNLLTLPFDFKSLMGIFFGSLFLMFGGFLDDKHHLKPWQSVIFPIIAALVVTSSGIGIKVVNNPFGSGLIHLDQNPVLSGLLTFSWLLILMYSTKLLDGLDGLVTGLTLISALIISCFCLFSVFFQPELAKIGFILAGASAGFLVFNFHPAKIFLGEGGSLFAGFILGIFSIISGSKIAITFLIVGIAIIDLFWAMTRRFFIKHQSPFTADKGHLHHQLINLGFSHRGAVSFYWFLSIIFGFAAFFLRTRGKIVLISLLMLFVISLLIFLERKASKEGGS